MLRSSPVLIGDMGQFFVPYKPLAALMASSGHDSVHRPHSRQCPLSIRYTSPSDMTSTGQASRHKPQAVHLEVIIYSLRPSLRPSKIAAFACRAATQSPMR